ncbi:translation initiation factor IF-2 [Aureliella helgolandensis]|uniref:Translation initiation factor IF-2 n=1 Tax=Aureliella helgolandensis TaxID=2527968 RepID=A0A518GGR1_9BACT|nr:translation initiation factor IF-2 [Aureliella helgolandensis]QDV27770.1 Translation initiation factor IF-2 [Aureliella helgolandensis]
MPKRIYALAKELTMDSKDLVDLCTKIGILNKGSALASLDDDEVQRIEKHLADKAAVASKPQPAPTTSKAKDLTPTRPSTGPLTRSTSVDTGKIRALDARPKPSSPQPAGKPEELASKAAATEAPATSGDTAETVPDAAPSTPEEATTTAPSAAQPTGTAKATAPVADTTADVPSGSETEADAETEDSNQESEGPKGISRGSYNPISPGGGGRIRSLDARRPSGSDSKPEQADERRKPPQRREPVINLARLPSGRQTPVPPPKSNEPAPQRPEIRFTKDDISGQKQGMKAPLQELEQQNTAKESRGKGKTAGTAASGTAGSGGLTQFKADADRAKGKFRKGDDDDDKDLRGKKASSGIAAARSERKRRGRGSLDSNDDDRRSYRGGRRLVRKGTNTAAPRKENVTLELPCSVRSFSEAAGVPAGRVIGTLMQMGHGVTINASLDAELAELLAAELGVELEFRQAASLEEDVVQAIEEHEDTAESLVTRPPIVTFLGHVDHGKTSLLDYLIGTSVVSGEAGGITQHIRAYQIEKDGRVVSFVDTPGHEAFTEMRARGANVTDIAVVVIAADDGIMPQTAEAIVHAKAAEVPIVVALNKIDLPGVDQNRILTQMTEHGLTPSEWGGDVEVVRTSAISGEGMDELLETLLTVAELHDFRANPNRRAVGVCLESEQASDKGVIAKFIVQNGTLNVGDIVLCGSSHGRIKAMYDTLKPNLQLKSAGPTVPVNITGLDMPPGAGERFYVLDDIAQARSLAETREDTSRAQSLSGTSPKVSFEAFQDMLQSGRLGVVEDKVELNIILRADARGSLEAIEKELSKLEHPEVQIRLLQRSVGGISVADVTLASASGAVIVGFNVIPDENARSMADDRHVEIRRYDIIYKLAEDIKAIIEGRLRPEERIVELGRALVKTVFNITRVGAVAGCYVAQGSIERGCRIRVNRDGRTIGDYALDSVKRHKDDVKEVPRGMECGIKLHGFNDLKQDDVLEAYRIEEVARKLD